jgi:hypothetical protein
MCKVQGARFKGAMVQRKEAEKRRVGYGFFQGLKMFA